MWVWLCMVYTLGCVSDNEIDWARLYTEDNAGFQSKIQSQTPMTRQNIWLSILSTHPEEASSICAKLTNTIAKQTCKRFQNRPHLQTISPLEQNHWSGGALGERTVFPREFVPLRNELSSIESVLQDPECLKSAICLQTQAEERSLSDWKDAAVFCRALETDLAQSDCLFHIAESLPVHVDRYETAAKLCAMSGGFSGECHNHVLLKYASKMYDRVDWHEQLIERFTELYPEGYASVLTDVYWSIVAFRVIGMEYPLDTARFLNWPDTFQPHLKSIVALRMWEEEGAWQKSNRALKGEMMRVAKARGPSAPRFTPKEKWSVRDGSMNWIRFCDVRGGHRPTHSHPDVDLAWALLTAFAMSDEFMEDKWMSIYNGIGQEHWEIRWAMARLLSKSQKESILYARLKADTDSRVLQALY